MSILFPICVLGLALAMLVAHVRSWVRMQAHTLNAEERLFRDNKFRRRMQASSLLALVAPTMLAGQRVAPMESPWIFVSLWAAVALATCWIGWLAILDAIASGRHFRRLSRERAETRARLKSEMEHIVADARTPGGSTSQAEP